MQVDLKKFLVILIKGPENRVLKFQTDNETPGSKQNCSKVSDTGTIKMKLSLPCLTVRCNM